MADLVILTRAELTWWLGVTGLTGACLGAIVVLAILRRHDRQARR